MKLTDMFEKVKTLFLFILRGRNHIENAACKPKFDSVKLFKQDLVRKHVSSYDMKLLIRFINADIVAGRDNRINYAVINVEINVNNHFVYFEFGKSRIFMILT